MTWIGVHQLGYAEFGEIQRSLRYGVGNERRAIGNNVYLATLAERLSGAPDLDGLWAILTDAAHRLQFDRAELRVVVHVVPREETVLRDWRGRDGGSSDPAAVWTVPLVVDGEAMATVVLTRSLRLPAHFDHGYLLNALSGAFTSKLATALQINSVHNRSESHLRLDRPPASRPSDVTVAIPTFQREAVLINTLEALLQSVTSEVIVVDQTPRHEVATEARLRELSTQGRIRWVQLDQPSIPHAMNVALLEARSPIVLFLDDDVEPARDLIAAHAASYGGDETWAVVGQVLQPGQEPDPRPQEIAVSGLRAFLDFRFNSTQPAWVASVIACNLSVRRERALGVGGFDENFVGVAYRFETEFCRRLIRSGGRVRFEPMASVRHLRAPRGGTRSAGRHESPASPAHGVGDYYFALGEALGPERLRYLLRRPLREVCTRFDLRHPWWIPVKLIGEARAFAWAWRLRMAGPSYTARKPSPLGIRLHRRQRPHDLDVSPRP